IACGRGGVASGLMVNSRQNCNPRHEIQAGDLLRRKSLLDDKTRAAMSVTAEGEILPPTNANVVSAKAASRITPEHSSGSAWEPFREPLFRSLWIAAVVSYTGTWMQNVGAGWLMTTLTVNQPHAPLMVGLVQAASSLPVFLVALPA